MKNTPKSSVRPSLLGAGLLLLASSVAQAADPAVICESSKLGTSAKYAQCRLKAEAKAVKAGAPVDYSKCTLAKFDAAETKAGMGVCPSEGDQADIGTFVDACTDSVAVALGGGALPLNVIDCNDDLGTCATELVTCDGGLATCDGELATCDGDLAACQSNPPARPLKTGQTGCWNAAGTSIGCSGSGQDGEFQNGATRSFTNNGDGTITDNATGLMWEVLSDDGSIHDKDDTYTWTNAYAMKIDGLNGVNFAGHSDWRLPNRLELETLRDLGASSPATDAAFDTGCVATCTVGTCSCTALASYWSSTTVSNNPDFAWNVFFTDGGASPGGSSKAGANRVRAVRGTSDAESCTVGELAAAEVDIAELVGDVADCQSDLIACATNCDVVLGQPVVTGQTTSYGPGSDGSLQKGLGRSFTDNGDGTITDNVTGLMWEKKSDDGSIHDQDNGYTWGMTSPPYTMNGTMVTTFLADLNSGGGFAGHTDWRIPNLNELETIRNLEEVGPATYAEFNNGCTGGCTVTTCSCTRSYFHWSSSTYRSFEDLAWLVYFYDGNTYAAGKTSGYAVRAVRAGS